MAFGIDLVVIPSKGTAAINEDAIKTSAGALFHLKLCRSHHYPKALEFLKNSGLTLVGASEQGTTDHHIAWDGPYALIMGSEGEGLGKTSLALCDHLMRIDMDDQIGSLNVSVAAGILLSKAYASRK